MEVECERAGGHQPAAKVAQQIVGLGGAEGLERVEEQREQLGVLLRGHPPRE